MSEAMNVSAVDARARYLRARKLYIWLLLLAMPVVFPVAIVLSKLFRTYTPGFIFAGVWILVWFASAIWAIVLRARMKIGFK
jgi:hypothetical protein